MAGESRRLHKAGSVALVTIAAVFLSYLFVGPYLGYRFEYYAGDLIDGRFNLIVLEHGYRWLCGLEASFWSPRFFFPYANVLAFGDCQLGSLPFYALFRALGADRYTALQLFVFLGAVLNFVACFWVLRKVGCGSVPSAFGAALFSGSLPAGAFLGFIQLHYRFCAPLSWYFFHQWLRSSKLRPLLVASLFLVWQTYISFYLGVFVAMLLAAYFLSYLVVGGSSRVDMLRREARAMRWLSAYWRPNRSWLGVWRSRAGRGSLHLVFCGAGALLLLLPMAIPYYRVSQATGMRPWSEVMPSLPTGPSFLTTRRESIAWGSSLGSLDSERPMRHEFCLFPGMLPLLAMAASVFLLFRRRQRLPDLEITLLLCCAVLFFAVCRIGDSSAYRLLFQIPGIGAIRVVSRIVLILLVPMSMVYAFNVARLVNLAKGSRLATTALVLVLAGLHLGDQGVVTAGRLNQEWMADRLAEFRRSLRSDDLEPGAVVAYIPRRPISDWDLLIAQLDIMEVSQQEGWRLINGYSGNTPKGYYHMRSCSDLLRILERYGRSGSPGTPEYADVHVLGDPADGPWAQFLERTRTAPSEASRPGE